MRIQDLENRTLLERATIRFYEREGLITPKRSENGYREYSDDDVEHLMKIKLLRQLGLSVDTIKQLQQGREDFSDALTRQVSNLNTQIDAHKRARAVCQVIQEDGVNYNSMDAERYLMLFREISVENRVNGKSIFREDVPKEIHPIRRFAARILDIHLFNSLIQFILFVILRIRPLPVGILATVISYTILLLYIPVESLFIHLWGTTPGKWVMGIRVDSVEGGKLSYFYALCRSWEVFRYGLGFNLPVWSWICLVRSFCQLTGRAWRPFVKYDELEGPMEMEWDRDAEITYYNWEKRGKMLAAGFICVILLLDCGMILDSIRPRYRGTDVTVEEFAENYNAYITLISQNGFGENKLRSDGSWQRKENQIIIMDLTGRPEDVYANFNYETEDGIIRRISYENSWTDVFVTSPLAGKCMLAAIAAASAQDWCNIISLYDFSSAYRLETALPQGQFRYENIEVIWNMDLMNCRILSGSNIMEIEETKPSSIDLYFEIIIHDA